MQSFEKATRIGISPSKDDYAVGAWRTLLMNYVAGLRYGEPTLLRVDDTNTKRFNPATFQSNYDSLKMILEEQMGINFTLTPELDSNGLSSSSLIQSKNKHLYQDATDELAAQGLIADRENGSRLLSLDDYIDRYGGKLQVSELNRDLRTVDLRDFFQAQDGGKKYIPILAEQGRPLFSIASVVDDHTLNVGTVVRSVKARDIQVQQDMIRQALSYEPVSHLYLPIWDTPGEKKVGYMDLIKSGIASQAIVSYMASSLWGDSTAIYTDINEVAQSFNEQVVSKSPSQPFEIDKLHNISSRLTKTYKARGGEVLKLVQNISESQKSTIYETAKGSLSLVSLINSEDRSLIDIYENVRRIVEPDYEDMQDIASKLGISSEDFSDLLRNLVSILNEASFRNLELDTNIEKLIQENGKRTVYSCVRYIVSGSSDGVHPQYGIDYLREINGLQERLRAALLKVEELSQ